MMTALDIVDEAVGENKTPDDDTGGAAPDVMVCPYEGPDGKPCGASFVGEGGRKSAKIKLNGHTVGVHNMTWDGKPTPRNGRKKESDQPPVQASKTEAKAAKKATGHVSPIVNDSNRAAIYTQSLATFGLLGHLAAGRWFDDYDLNVWTNGAPGLANALDAVGEQNPGLRRTCDLLLAGGTGGAYVQLILASAMIAVPIAAHHDLLPRATGERFGAMIGAMSAPSQAEPPQSGPSAQAEGEAPPPNGKLPMEAWGMDEWREVLFAAPMNPTAQQVMQEALSGMPGGAIGVTIPDNLPGTEPFTMPTEEAHRGSVIAAAQPDTNGEAVPVEPAPAG